MLHQALFAKHTLWLGEAGAVLMAEEGALPSILMKCLNPGLMAGTKEVLTDSPRLR